MCLLRTLFSLPCSFPESTVNCPRTKEDKYCSNLHKMSFSIKKKKSTLSTLICFKLFVVF